MIEISFCREDEISRLIKFVGEHWKANHIFVKKPEFIRWHYGRFSKLQVPSGGLSVIVAREEGELVGMLGLNELTFGLDGRIGMCLWTSIWYARPELRKKAIGMRLWQYAIGLGPDAICMTGMNPSVKPFFELLKFEIMYDTPRYGAVLCPRAMAALIGDGSEAITEGTMASLLPSKPGKSSSRVFHLGGEEKLGWDHYFAENILPTFCGALKDSQYLSWRYEKHPIFDYHCVVFKSQNGLPNALAVYRYEEVAGQNYKILRILELLGDHSAKIELLSHLIFVAQQERAIFCDINVMNAEMVDTVENAGLGELNTHDPIKRLIPHRFHPVDSPANPLISAFKLRKDNQIVCPSMIGHPNFYFSRADGDQDRPN